MHRHDRRPRSGPLVLAAVVFAVGAGAVAAQAPDHPGQYLQADIEHGFKLYTERCAVCHAADGIGIGSVDLRSGRFRRAATDRLLTRLITTGIPEVGMPASTFSEPEMTSLVSYLRNMRNFDAGTAVLGDPGRGRMLFDGRGGCTQCHRLDGKPTGMAPDLGGIGAVRSPSALERSLLDPSAAMHPVNRPVRIVTREGRVINGRRLNEDTYTVQLVDERGELLSLDKDALREYTVSTISPKPSYKDKLTPREISDLVAYLVSLKGS